jgi:hypothetical protein
VASQGVGSSRPFRTTLFALISHFLLIPQPSHSYTFIQLNLTFHGISATSTDVKMEDTPETNGHVEPGVSLRFGPVKSAGDVDMQDILDANSGTAGKRKARTSVGQRKSYAEPESSEDEDQPLVRRTSLRHFPRFP